MKKKRVGQRGRAAALMGEINSAMGKPVVKLGDDPYFEIVRIPTGSLTLDRLTGGGFALGRHVELFGDESSCKSYVMYRTMALSQRRGNLCALIDPEHSFDAKWFKHLGGFPDELLLEHPETAEEAIKTMMLLAKMQDEGLEIVGMDSVAALLPLEELKKDPEEEDRIAPQARMMSRALRRITSQNHRVLFLWTNQVRTKIGVMFGNPISTPGGRALKFYDTTRIELKRGEKIKKKSKKARKGKLQDTPVEKGRYVYCRSEKEKASIPGRDGMFEWDSDQAAIVLESEIINLGLEDGFIKRNHNTYTFIDSDEFEWSGQDRDFRRLLRENEPVRDELVEAIADMTIQLSVPTRSDEDDG